ncbi:alpha/beta hydrolase [Leifsonia poae]|uniref:alpha/beta hydrolase n=1 Tax=Leifsonia poae TaxID=110933 RepID=UPI003D6743E3
MNVHNPGAGEPPGIVALARARSAKAESLRQVYATVNLSAASVAGSAWRGKAQESFTSAIESVTPELLLLANGLDAQANALQAYAGQVQQIKDRQAALESQRSHARADLEADKRRLTVAHGRNDRVLLNEAAASRDERTAEILRQRARIEESISSRMSSLNQIEAQWDELVRWRNQVDRVCAEALSGPTVLGRLSTFTDTAVRAAAPAALLKMLRGLSATDLRVLLTVRPELADQLAQTDPRVVAAWWTRMDAPGKRMASVAQAALIAGIPAILGNLNGVAFWARDRANTVFLEQSLAKAYGDPHANGDRIKALEAVKRALGRGMLESPPRQLVSLSLEPDPKAAISRGDLDKARRITYLVPGMGTNVAGDIRAYSDAAYTLWRIQTRLAGGNSSKTAVLAWLDYSPPSADDAWGVAHDQLAEVGARRLSAAINGVRAVHSVSVGPVDLSVVGHSYGSTVSALAMKRSSVEHLVLLGSAGIPTSITDAGRLLVPSGQVFASQGHHDAWATTGQIVSGRQDPTSPSFAAHAFSSERGEDEQGRALHEISQHGPFAPKGESGKYSYLDNGTSAIYNTAKITIGQGSTLPIHDTPAERLALQAQDRAIDMIRNGTPWVPQK